VNLGFLESTIIDKDRMAENRKTKLSRTFTYGTEVLNIDNNIAITTVSGSISGFAATIAKQPIQRIKWIRQVSQL